MRLRQRFQRELLYRGSKIEARCLSWLIGCAARWRMAGIKRLNAVGSQSSSVLSLSTRLMAFAWLAQLNALMARVAEEGSVETCCSLVASS